MTISLSYFNSHVGFLGRQELNTRGRKMLEFIEKWNLVLLNGDQDCDGEITRIRGEQKSTIDFMMVSQTTYQTFNSMNIDEKKGNL